MQGGILVWFSQAGRGIEHLIFGQELDHFVHRPRGGEQLKARDQILDEETGGFFDEVVHLAGRKVPAKSDTPRVTLPA